MGWRTRAAALCAFAATMVPVQAARAAQGSDAATRGDHILYTADPGEANRFVAEPSDVGLHLRDSGAIIRWTSGDACTAVVHDVNCMGGAGGFAMHVRLGDGADTFVNRSEAVAEEVFLGPGNDRAVGGDVGYLLDGGPGADDLHGGRVNREYLQQAVTYVSSKRAVTVTNDNKRNDGARREHDNVHADVYQLVGSRYGDRISGFVSELGGAGNDRVIGSRRRNTLDGGNGNDVLVGRAGRDTLTDYRGNNVFRARDHTVDHIQCGSGHDIVYADLRDVIRPPRFDWACEDVRIR